MTAEYRIPVPAQQSDFPQNLNGSSGNRNEQQSEKHKHGHAPRPVWFRASMPDEGSCLFTGITVVDGNVIVCDNENKSIKRFNIHGDFLDHLELTDPCGICALTNSNNVAVTEPDRRQITTCSLDGALSLKSVARTEKKYECICSFKDKFIVGCCELGLSSVDILDVSGTILRSVAGTRDGQKLFRNPSSVAYTISDDIIISDTGSCSVLCIGFDGTVKFRFDPKGRPSGVCVDAMGEIYVAQYDSNLVYKLTPAGILDRIVVDQRHKVVAPLAITVANSMILLTEELPSERILRLKFAEDKRPKPSKVTANVDIQTDEDTQNIGASLSNLQVNLHNSPRSTVMI